MLGHVPQSGYANALNKPVGSFLYALVTVYICSCLHARYTEGSKVTQPRLNLYSQTSNSEVSTVKVLNMVAVVNILSDQLET